MRQLHMYLEGTNICLNMFRLSVWTMASLNHELDLILVDGEVHTLKKSSIETMIVAGWVLYIASLLLNFVYYKIHPSATDISCGALKKRMVCQSLDTDSD